MEVVWCNNKYIPTHHYIQIIINFEILTIIFKDRHKSYVGGTNHKTVEFITLQMYTVGFSTTCEYKEI